MTIKCNIGPRRSPESNIGPSAKQDQYCLRARSPGPILYTHELNTEGYVQKAV